MADTLVVIYPGRLPVAGGRGAFVTKRLEGVREYVRHWPGEVVLVAPPAPWSDAAPGSEPLPLDEVGLDVEVTDDPGAAVRRRAPRVVLAPLKPEAAALLGAAPLVLVSDYAGPVRWQNARSDGTPAWRLPQVGLGLLRLERRLRTLAAAADGLQCNGPHTYARQARWSSRPHLFHDTRATDADVAAALAGPPAAPGPLRLAFSGRWVPQKGVLDALAVHAELVRGGVDAHLTVFGGGELEPEVRARAGAGAGVTVAGRVPFRSAWVPRVRDDVDVMVLPHHQGDSASTFLESMSCGTPVAGYDTVYWSALQRRTGGGWVGPARAPSALAELVAGLAADPGAVLAARRRGLTWAAEHTVEKEFAGRVGHLREVAGV
ncbi:glycosyltransferase [Phycicoccus duodecadis]|uniref:Glycosyltransferase involved in cell wall biosynthesis n=1 Tax=Phycicoccus duodecadis TaxID=173053 RepID=A0A2N3YMG6_9MICO|nr:glycosyltransferase [Phycicoccus duodecadis]PKW27998.1 glycosyltransferase involved in cell wall biosynthesis [Phycicoccus duodecadis]